MGTVELFKQSLEDILKLTRQELPDTVIILMEPYLLTIEHIISDEMVKNFQPYQIAVQELSKYYDIIYVNTQKPLEEAALLSSTSYWCPDGIHPSPAGIEMLADLWTDGYSRI